MPLPPTQLHAIINQPAANVYKDDRRTRVVSVRDDAGRHWVVKTFNHHPVWQAIMWLARCHPAQREARQTRRLATMQLPVTPIAGITMRRRCAGLGGIGYLVSPYIGESVYRQLNRDMIVDRHARRQLAGQLAQLTAKLLERGLIHGDYKASNILVDDHGQLWLIDTDRIASSRSRARLIAMLATLDETAMRARASRAERLRFLAALLERVELGTRRDVVGEIQNSKLETRNSKLEIDFRG
jgi:tRNA A-37 threonylcarbamoyl transferase component Bud32